MILDRQFGERLAALPPHEEYSTDRPYSELEVYGARLTGDVRAALQEFRFAQFEEWAEGFLATRDESAGFFE